MCSSRQSEVWPLHQYGFSQIVRQVLYSSQTDAFIRIDSLADLLY